MTEARKTFSKTERLCSETQIAWLFQQGESLMAYPMRVVWMSYPAESESSVQVVMSVPKKKLKHAVDRNRVKRHLREAYRLNKQELVDFAVEHRLSFRIAFVWIPSEVLLYEKINRKMAEVLGKIQRTFEEPVVSAQDVSDLDF
jgi:ribonuclease P protein component